MTVIRLRDLTIDDPSGRRLVDGVTLTLPTDGILCIIGETGSGKSLIAEALFGLVDPKLRVSGRLERPNLSPIALHDRDALATLWRETFFLLPQEPTEALDPTMRIGGQLAKIDGRERVAAALTDVDLTIETARLHPFRMSGGMRQRALVAGALLAGSPVIVADEPTKGLDPARVSEVVGRLRDLAASRRSLVVVTHDPAVVRGLGGRLAVIADGRLVEEGETAAVLAAPRSAALREWLAADPSGWPACACRRDHSRRLLSVEDLAFAWPGRPALFEGVRFDVHPHDVVGIDGPSGTGKSTLVDLLTGLKRPVRGRVIHDGFDVHHHPRRGPSRVQKLHQDPTRVFLPGRPVGRQLADLARVAPAAAQREPLDRLLDDLRLSRRILARRPEEISGGEAQRLALLRLLLLDPQVIVADEPTSRLDPVVQRHTIDLLMEQVEQRGLGLVLVAHDRRVLSAVCRHIVTLGSPPIGGRGRRRDGTPGGREITTAAAAPPPARMP